MAISHNLSVVNNNLSGFDPVAGEVDGTTIGRSYLLWQVFQGLAAFDSNIVMISSSGATPSWLASESGTIMSAPEKNAATNNQTIKWFDLSDPGLSGSIPNVFIHEWGTTTDVSSTNTNLISVTVRHLISGSTPYVPFTSGSIVVNDNGSSVDVSNCMVSVGFSGGSTTTMSTIPKIIYWKSSNMHAVFSISKLNAGYAGALYWFTPTYTGYKASLSGSITYGSDLNCIVFSNSAYGITWVSALTQEYETNLKSTGNYYNLLTSSGLLPTTKFVISGSLTLLTNKIKIGLVGPATFKCVSQEIEGLELANDASVGYSTVSICQLNNSYYLTGHLLYDGTGYHRTLLKLN